MTELVLISIIFILFAWRIKKGFSNGMTGEIVTLVSGIVSLITVVLILAVISSVMVKATSTLILCVIGLTLLGIAFKICELIFKPILVLSNFSVIGSLNRLLGAVMGAAEACILSIIVCFIFDYIKK